MKIIAVIPARYEASRFPGKLMEILADETVIFTTYTNTLETGLFQDVFVATDSKVIFEEITSKGGRAIMTGSHETGSDRIAEAIKEIDCDIVVNIQGDEPFIRRKPLEDLISVFVADTEKEISLASLRIPITEKEEIENPNCVKVITDNNGFALYFSRSVIPFIRETHSETQYFRHIGVYAYRKDALLEFANLPMQPLEISEKIECIRYLEYGKKIKMVETSFSGVGIDTPKDLERARALYLAKNRYR
ncbi:MAG: 3-deoxy-manno-octulosonate cytidylyltransferase [Bergeyella sp.]|nr:3-deoxy-manno-octulosonate cytidylyltransferase [Bergeyella sp.]